MATAVSPGAIHVAGYRSAPATNALNTRWRLARRLCRFGKAHVPHIGSLRKASTSTRVTVSASASVARRGARASKRRSGSIGTREERDVDLDTAAFAKKLVSTSTASYAIISASSSSVSPV